MTLRIDRGVRRGFTLFALSGRIEAEHVAELMKLFELGIDYRSILVDLKDVKLVDREAVRFLARCQADGVTLENCPAFIREWMEREKE